MKISKIVFLLQMFVIIWQSVYCQNTGRPITFHIKELPKVGNLKLSELGFTDIDYIPLETNEKSLVKRITDIKICEDFLLIQYYAQILMFKTDGKFVTKIGTVGRGPNEFTVIHDVDIDEKNRRIYLVSGWQRKFFVYSVNGKFIRTIQCPLNTTQFRVTEDGLLCYSINSFANIVTSFNLIDSTGRIIKRFPNKYPFKAPKGRFLVFIFENLFYKHNNQLFKKEIYSDTIYSFEKSSFKPYAVIDQGKRLITPKVRSTLIPDQIAENYFQQQKLFEFGEYIYYEYLINGNLFGLIGSKKKNLTMIIDPKKGIYNDMDSGPNIWPRAEKGNDTLISWIDAIELKKYVASEIFKKTVPKYPEKKMELERLANNLKETDNPILILVKLKEH